MKPLKILTFILFLLYLSSEISGETTTGSDINSNGNGVNMTIIYAVVGVVGGVILIALIICCCIYRCLCCCL